MTPETKKALLASIEHWEANLAAETPDEVWLGPRNCDLCRMFHDGWCSGCPVMAATGCDGCVDTPYEDAWFAFLRWRSDGDEYKSAFRAEAQKMLDFLKGLVP